MISQTRARWGLLAGVSLLAVGVEIGLPRPAEACLSVTSQNSLFGSTSCVSWTGGNFSITNTGTISSASPSLSVSVTGNTLTNSGHIIGSRVGIDNVASSTIANLTNNATGTITSSYTAAIENAGSIGVLSNSGTITGTNSNGLANDGGTIDTLTNTGTITGANNGLLNTGVINTLTNNGWIADNFVAGIYNGSIIGLLTNNGTISGAVALANLGGSIGTLVNTGRIVGISYGLYSASGSLGTLFNSGTISGGSGAIYIGSTSTFGPLTNSGLIAGGITNGTSNTLTINGGSGSTFGTLTGASGGADRGTIVNTLSNVVFSLGNLLLNDNINATGHTVVNSAATLRLDNAITITGGYYQTGGGLLITATNGGASYGYLTVSGNATVNNSTVTISGAGLTIGQSYTIVRSGGTGSYANDTAVVAVTSGLSATITTVGQDLVVTLLAGASEGGGTTTGYTAKGSAVGGVGGAAGTMLDRIAAGTSPQAIAYQNTILTFINSLPTAEQGAAIKQLAPTQNVPSSQMAFSAATAVLGAVEQHQQTAMAYDPAIGAAAGSDTHDSALWGEVLGGGAQRGSNAQADGYSLANFGLATGVDHRFTPNAMAGVALSWIRAWSEGRGGSTGSSSILDSYQMTLYGTYRLDRAFVDGQLGVGWNHFNQKRAMSLYALTAQSDYDGQQYLATATFGYDFPLTDSLTATPLASLSWLRAVSGSYQESGAGNADQFVARHGVNSLSQDLGGKLSWNFATTIGTVKPEVKAAWTHDYTQGNISTFGLSPGDTQPQAYSTPRTVADGVRLGAAAALNGSDALSFRAEYESELRRKYQSHAGIIKVIWGF